MFSNIKTKLLLLLLLISTSVGSVERYNIVRTIEPEGVLSIYYGCLIEVSASKEQVDFVAVCNGVDIEKIKLGLTTTNLPMRLTIGGVSPGISGKVCRLVSTSTGGRGSIFDFDCRPPLTT